MVIRPLSEGRNSLPSVYSQLRPVNAIVGVTDEDEKRGESMYIGLGTLILIIILIIIFL